MVDELPEPIVQSSRKEPEEEYFMLAVLALKSLHTEMGDAEYVFEISGTTLFEQVKEKKIPFHEWYKWLENHFDKLKKATDLNNKGGESEEDTESPPK